ncbi:Trappc2l [Columba guinea]|nr:Trappc2l [Columba guinea]
MGNLPTWHHIKDISRKYCKKPVIADQFVMQRFRFGALPHRYGYVTNSKVKFVMVVDSSNTALRDNEIRSMFRKLHNSYTDIMCNPFYNPGDRINSRAFDNMVNSMMMQVC